jgi:predicted AlkP superfamily pyrophosphatase or phosphodiesterase
MKRTVVLNVVGLTSALLGENTPNLSKLQNGRTLLGGITPAVTCSVQSTYLTGKLPNEHGIVGNGWYCRDLSEVHFWKQSNRLVAAEKIWQTAKKLNPAFTCANNFWWFNMVSEVDWLVTPRPLYCADGRKLPDCYSKPPELRAKFNREFGQFPLFKFWGPMTSIASSDWIARSAMAVEELYQPTLQLVYLPHLDYVLQREGPQGKLQQDLAEIDLLCGQLLDFFQERNCRVVVLSEYGITQVSRAIHPNRILRDANLLSLKVDLGREYLDFGESRAFAVADHQIAHLYIQNPADIPSVKRLFEEVPGIEQVLNSEEKIACGLDHARSGDLILISEADAWFSYYYWQEDRCAPDFARTVNIFAKPGYDPCELFIDPALRLPQLKVAWTLLKKQLGYRYLLDVIPLDTSLVKGSHGRMPDRAEEGPLLLTTETKLLPAGSLPAQQVYDLLLTHIFAD